MVIIVDCDMLDGNIVGIVLHLDQRRRLTLVYWSPYFDCHKLGAASDLLAGTLEPGHCWDPFCSETSHMVSSDEEQLLRISSLSHVEVLGSMSLTGSCVSG